MFINLVFDEEVITSKMLITLRKKEKANTIVISVVFYFYGAGKENVCTINLVFIAETLTFNFGRI